MDIEPKYMCRCLQLAKKGKGFVNPNPMVGAVVVCEGKIIGEGYHQEFGKAHAEVNAINSVQDKSLLKKSTIYVSLEPCSHYGKTPPCSQLIIDSKIPKVVVACLDPYHEVSGRGVKMLQEAGIEVTIGVMEKEAQELNKVFFTTNTKNRPYIYLKWAQTKDGYIDKLRTPSEPQQPTIISNDITRMLVHKLRSEVSAIMVGTNTAINDNPSLSTRYWYGKNPVRIILDREGKIPCNHRIFDNSVETIVFTETTKTIKEVGKTKYIPLAFNDNMLQELLSILKSNKIDSVLVEGGQKLLQSFINADLWDEAFIEVANHVFNDGVSAPSISGNVLEEIEYGSSKQIHISKC